jgi:hypothetical protein
MKLPVSVTFALLATAVFAQQQAIRLSDPVNVTEHYEEFGTSLPDDPKPVTLAALFADAESALGNNSVVETRVSKVCQKKGCFFIAQDGDVVVRVSFRDYAFFVPTDISGRTVMLSGTLVRRDVSDEQAAHFAADLGVEKTPVSAGVVYEIIADGVRVPKG